MASAFGFSVGDIISGISLIRDLIKALEDGAGSGQEYRGLIGELYGLEKAILQVKQLDIPEPLQVQKKALDHAIRECQETISTFLSRISKYSKALSSPGSKNAVKSAFRKMQWSLSTKDDIIKFRAQITGHTSSLMILLATLQQ
jgi:hypothetical protein